MWKFDCQTATEIISLVETQTHGKMNESYFLSGHITILREPGGASGWIRCSLEDGIWAGVPAHGSACPVHLPAVQPARFGSWRHHDHRDEDTMSSQMLDANGALVAAPVVTSEWETIYELRGTHNAFNISQWDMNVHDWRTSDFVQHQGVLVLREQRCPAAGCVAASRRSPERNSCKGTGNASTRLVAHG